MVTHVPLPYVIGHDYGPVPPWLDSLLILGPDEDLIWKNRPSLRRRYVDLFRPAQSEKERLALLRRFTPWLPRTLGGNHTWEIVLNSEGFRDAELPRRKSESGFRIVCLGDSWTFGMAVEQEQAYPQRLNALLRRQYPQGDFEVLNRGVLAYSSYQGLELLRKRMPEWAPDVVAFAFAMNDSKVAGYRDKDAARFERELSGWKRVGRLADKSEVYRSLRYLALILRHTSRPVGEHIKAKAEAAGGDVADFERLEPWTRVSLKDYESNVREMIRLARNRGADVILLHNELWEDGFYLRVLRKVSVSEGVPLVDGNALIVKERKKIEEDLERKLGLEGAETRGASEDGVVEVVFRVFAGDTPVPRNLYIAGSHPKLGDVVPNRVAMHDDGTHGDQRAGDSVWSYSATFPAGTKLFYVYTNSGREGVWEGLDVPHIRELTVQGEPGRRMYGRVESFGRIYLQADSWHTDAVGYDLIARAVLEALKDTQKFKEHVRSMAKSASGVASLHESR